MLSWTPKAELEEILAMEEDDENLCKPMNELNVDDKLERMATQPIFTFVQNYRSAEGLNLRNCVLLDSESTVCAFCNRNLLEKFK